MRGFKRLAVLTSSIIVTVCGCLSMTACSFDDIENLFGQFDYMIGGMTGEADLEKQDEAVVEVMIRAANNIRANLMLLGQDPEEGVKSLNLSSGRVKYWEGTGNGVVYCKLTYKYSGMTETSYCKADVSDYNQISNFRTMESYQWNNETMSAGEGYKWVTTNTKNINAAFDYYLENGTYDFKF
ncbi:MAG: hypothetical protein J6K86_02060 [Clostridia bacterium]|nr:hypothetical protein [Clostridia bacterium]